MDYLEQKSDKNRGHIQIPKDFFYGDRYKALSPMAKLAYGLLRDRSSLSQQNGKKWIDSNGNVYIYFTVKELADLLHCSTDTAGKIMRELDAYKLIVRTRQGQGKPWRVVVMDMWWNPNNADSGYGKKRCTDPANFGRNNTNTKNIYRTNKTASPRELDEDEILAIQRAMNEE